MEEVTNIYICSTELSSKGKKKGLFPEVLKKYLDKHQIPYEVNSLVETGGDYLVLSSKLVVERKTMADFIHTWLHGDSKGKIRLETQLDLALRSYPECRVALMIEDYYRCTLDHFRKCVWIPTYEKYRSKKSKNMGFYRIGVNPKSLKGKLNALENRIQSAKKNADDPFDRLEIVKCSGGRHALQWFLEQIEGKKTKKRKSVKVHRIKRKTEDLRERRLFFLEGLPNIGGGTSTKLLDEYKSPIEAIRHIDEWLINPNLKRMSKPMVMNGKKVLGLPLTDEQKNYADESG